MGYFYHNIYLKPYNRKNSLVNLRATTTFITKIMKGWKVSSNEQQIFLHNLDLFNCRASCVLSQSLHYLTNPSPNYSVITFYKTTKCCNCSDWKHLHVTNEMLLKTLVFHWVENIVGKGENGGYQHFLLFVRFQKGFLLWGIKSWCVIKDWQHFGLKVLKTFYCALEEEKCWYISQSAFSPFLTELSICSKTNPTI